MIRGLIVSLVITMILVTVMAVPAMAAQDEQSVDASVTVSEVVSITLADAGTLGINFGEVTPPDEVGDADQSEGTPAVGVYVGLETNVNVDISIRGEATGLLLENWKYSLTFSGSKVSIPATYGAPIYSDAAAESTSPIYHWVNVPAGTSAGTKSCTVYYKASTTSS